MGAFLHHQEVLEPTGKPLRRPPSTLIHKEYWDGGCWCWDGGWCCCCCFEGNSAVRLCLAAWVWTPLACTALAPSSTPQPGSGRRLRPWLLWPWLSNTSLLLGQQLITHLLLLLLHSSSGSVLVLDDGMAGGEGVLARLREEDEAPRSCAITAAFSCTPLVRIPTRSLGFFWFLK